MAVPVYVMQRLYVKQRLFGVKQYLSDVKQYLFGVTQYLFCTTRHLFDALTCLSPDLQAPDQRPGHREESDSTQNAAENV